MTPARQVPQDELLVRREQERLTRPLGLLMRADGLDELKRLLDDLGVEIEPAFVSVLEDVEMTPDRELNVTAYDNVAVQDRIASLPTHAAWFRGAIRRM